MAGRRIVVEARAPLLGPKNETEIQLHGLLRQFHARNCWRCKRIRKRERQQRVMRFSLSNFTLRFPMKAKWKPS